MTPHTATTGTTQVSTIPMTIGGVHLNAGPGASDDATAQVYDGTSASGILLYSLAAVTKDSDRLILPTEALTGVYVVVSGTGATLVVYEQ